MIKIKNIKTKEILDSRGNPTVEVEIETNDGSFLGAVPSGASKGDYEALEIRDEDGRGVKKAQNNIRKIIAKAIKDKEFSSQKEIDDLLISLDGTENKCHLGVNAILPVSIAFSRALAADKNIPLYGYLREIFDVSLKGYSLPKPCFNLIEGGAHADNDLDIQEFMVVPQKQSFRENFKVASEIFESLRNILSKNFGQVAIGDEAGFAPKISKTDQALLLLKTAIENHPETMFGLDAAASQFFKDDKYSLEGQEMTRFQVLEFYKDLVNKFPIIFIEDPFSQDDWQGFEEITKELPEINILGDDLLTTNIKRIKEAQTRKACTGLILKPNQIGTVTETLEAAKLARASNWKILVAHRSGETKDNFIADLAVAVNAEYIKAGAPMSEERMVKYNRLMEIESELNKK